MRKRNGFTLIELLAIIVILAIIAVITVPIILNIIDNSKKGAAIDSAYGYKESIYKGFLTDLTQDNNKELPNGIYVIDSTGKLINSNGVVLNTNVSGNVPEENSWVELEKGQVVAYSLKMDDYVVTKYKDTDAEAVKNGEIAENAEAREARLEAERQTRAIETAKGIASSQTGATEIKDITDGWVAFINGELKAYSIKVTEGDYTYVVTDLDVDSSNSHAVADRTTSDLASKTSAEQAIVSTKVDSYVKAALTANSSLNDETAKTVADLGNLTNKADSGWIHFNKVNNSVVIVDYSLTYGTITANYSSLTDGNYVSTYGDARNKPVIIALGSDVCLTETDCFKVIEINGTTATLLANNNIDPSTGMQGENGQSYAVAFSKTNYWNVSGQTYPVDIYDSTKDKEPGNNDYSVAYYVNNYVTNLRNAGLTQVQTTGARILKKSEVDSRGIAVSYRASGEYYWLGSANASTTVYRWIGAIDYVSFTNSNSLGVRPVIVISTSDI